MPDYKLIALDLDGTLLDSNKVLTERNYRALEQAAARGITIVPTTGRVYSALPDSLLSLPFVHYLISVNGAEVRELKTGKVLYKAEIPWQRVVELMQLLDGEDVIYDCFMNNQAWMTETQKSRIDDFAPDEHYRRMLHDVRIPVPELKAFLEERKQDVQKSQFFINDMARREELMQRILPEKFPDLLVTSSVRNNVELNARGADKGSAMLALADALGIEHEATMSFGDGLNDVPMIRAAGLGVAMDNASANIKAAADYITADCDHDGVAQAVERFCLGGNV